MRSDNQFLSSHRQLLLVNNQSADNYKRTSYMSQATQTRTRIDNWTRLRAPQIHGPQCRFIIDGTIEDDQSNNPRNVIE
jgi:hypothetical protein